MRDRARHKPFHSIKGCNAIELITRNPFRLNLWPVLLSSCILFVLFLTPLTFTNLSILPAQAATSPQNPSCQPFTQVNDGAFGMSAGPNGTYSGEESFEVLVFNNQLYLGMEADSSLGARIWRTKVGVTNPSSQADWEEVAADASGRPFGISNIKQVDHIDSLAEFNGYIYASNANGGSNTLGTRIFRSPTGNPGSWEDVLASIGAGFGSTVNTNFKDMQVFQGNLCGGTQNWMTGTQVWCTADGTTWAQKNYGGFGAGANDNWTMEVWSGYVFNGALYFGARNLGAFFSDSNDDVGKLFRTTSLAGTPTWTEAFSSPPGGYRIEILGDLNDYLYISYRSPNGIVILRSRNGNSWTQVNTPGMDGDAYNTGNMVDSGAIHNGMLFVGVTNSTSGFELWRTSNGTEWEQVDAGGLGDSNNSSAELITFNDYIYAWTTNYVSGQEVQKSICSDYLPTPTPTSTPTTEPSPTPTESPTEPLQPTPTDTATLEPTPSSTPDPTETPLPTSTETLNPTPSDTPEATPTNTLEPSPTETNPPAPTPTGTPVPTETQQPTPTPPESLCLAGEESCSLLTGPELTTQVFLPLFVLR